MEQFWKDFFTRLSGCNLVYGQQSLFFRVGSDSPLTDFENESNNLNIAVKTNSKLIADWLSFLLEQIHNEVPLENVIQEQLKELYNIEFSENMDLEYLIYDMEDNFMFKLDRKAITPTLETKLHSHKTEDWGKEIVIKKRLTAVAIWDVDKVRDEFMNYYFGEHTHESQPLEIGMLFGVQGMPFTEAMAAIPHDDSSYFEADIFDVDQDLLVFTSKTIPPFIVINDIGSATITVKGVKGADGQLRKCTQEELAQAKKYDFKIDED